MRDRYSLQSFRDRTEHFTTYSLPNLNEWECWNTHSKLEDKVDFEGRMRPFRGNTVVFELGEDVQMLMRKIQGLLKEECGSMMAEELDISSCHLTLHDLKNEYNSEDVLSEISETRKEALRKIVYWKIFEFPGIRLRATRVFNMMNTSVVLGFEPVDDEYCRMLMSLYEEFHDVVPLDYELTPHVTIGYYKPGSYGKEEIDKLAEVFASVNRDLDLEISLSWKQLAYQEFSDMNHYYKL